jgi:hypothetical protein
MTEDEARLLQCCGPEGAGHFNEKPYPARWCVGSSCMAWRTTGRQKFKAPNGTLADVDLTGNGEWIDVGAFCGLAGAPR